MAKKYVAYVSSYTSGAENKNGIHVYDVDMKNGWLTEKEQVEITNSSWLRVSHDHRFLYSITDLGVESYTIEADGRLSLLNKASINGMRGCYLYTDYEDRFLFSAGYHDGKVTVLRLHEDGSIGEITDEIWHKGLGTAAWRNFRPHVQCVKMTRDNKFLLACDLGLDRVNVYALDHQTGKLKEADIIHCDQESAPRHMQFSQDGRFLYIVHEQKKAVDVWSYQVDKNGTPDFERIQSISTTKDPAALGVAACSLKFSWDYRYLVTSNAGENSVTVFDVDQKTGLLSMNVSLPIAGEYPKDATLLPDNKHLISLNHESNSMTFFHFHPDTHTIVMNGPELSVHQPNCIVFYELGK
ncbi:MAG: lactonase family protein [Lachnospiraceae bacterium]|nr:lactonase family protein [Lachnospiraceae bacterium]